MLMPYFGKWPDWFGLYLESCRWNPEFNWLFFTDCGVPNNVPCNVRFVQVSLSEYLARASKQLGFTIAWKKPYKLCDLRPAFGLIHYEELAGYDCFGFGDIDVIYGRLSVFLTNEVLNHVCISTHKNRLSGHFALFKACDQNLVAFRQIHDFKRKLLDVKSHCLDETDFGRLFINDPRSYFQEQFSTIHSRARMWLDGTNNYPKNWYWRSGMLTNDKDVGREFMYLHFMYWKPGTRKQQAWDALKTINSVRPVSDVNSFRISTQGFHECS